MAKRIPKAARVFDPEGGHTHYEADSHSGNVTLCGQTDWIGQKEPGQESDNPVDCYACLSVVKYVKEHKFED